MNYNECHIFDLDSTLWSIDRQVWIIDKSKPNLPIMKIDESDFNLIKSGIFRYQDNPLKFNGQEFFLPENLMEDLKVKLKKTKGDIGNLGFSMQEYLDKNLIKDLDFNILKENIRHLKNKNDDVYAISSKAIKGKYDKLLDELSEQLKDLGLKVSEYYLISETFYNQDKDENIYKKGTTILRHLFGYKIKEGQFVNEKCEMYDEVHYYDADCETIDSLENLQFHFESILNKTEDESVKSDISKIIRKKPKFNLNYVTTNEMNKFETKQLNLTHPKKVMMFESFILNRKIN